MRCGRTPWLRWVAVLCLLLFAASAQAAVKIAGPPPGWDVEPSPAARDRAAEWADALEASVSDVYSPRSEDGFSETLAVLTLRGAMNPGADLDPESTLSEAVGSLFESEPESPRFVEGSEGAPIVTGVWDEDDVTYEVAVVSAGPNRAAVILAVRSAERSLYAQVFDEVVESITGAIAPVTAFPLQQWRIGIAVCWLAALALGWLGVGATSYGRDGAASAGRAVAGGSIFLGLVAAGGASLWLSGSEPALHLAGVSRFTVATEVAAGGIVVALIAWFAGTLRDSTVRRVESAPTGGTFSPAANQRTLTNNLVPPSQPAALTDPGHGMTPEALDEADKAIMKKRQPQATLVGAPSLASSGSGDPAFDEVWAKAQAAAEAEADAQAEAEAAEANQATTQLSRPNFEVPEEVTDPPKEEPRTESGTIVGPAPAPDAPAEPKKKVKTKTAVLQFPPPMSDD